MRQPSLALPLALQAIGAGSYGTVLPGRSAHGHEQDLAFKAVNITNPFELWEAATEALLCQELDVFDLPTRSMGVLLHRNAHGLQVGLGWLGMAGLLAAEGGLMCIRL
jgi:hypothetical protein